MSAETELNAACDRWQRLAEAEGAAIRTRDWAALAACQASIRELQPQLTLCLGNARAHWVGMSQAAADRERDWRARIDQLLALEKRNAEALAQARHEAELRFARLTRATHTLRRVRASYAPVDAAAWCSFS